MDDACTPVTAVGVDGARLTCCPHGGHVLGWVPAAADASGDGPPAGDRLWVSPLTRCGPGTAIRGGIPVIFPQFSSRGPLPKHGFARDRAWQVLPAGPDDGAARWSALLVDDEATRAVWPHPFELRLDAVAAGAQLRITLTAGNTGTDPFELTAALHGYLRLAAGPDAALTGVGGRVAQDNAADGAGCELPADPLPALDPRDVAVLDVDGPVRLDDPGLGPLTVTAEGLPDRVLWNPGPGHGLADVPDGGEREFVCVEAAVLTPVRLEPGASWTGTQVIRSGDPIGSR